MQQPDDFEVGPPRIRQVVVALVGALLGVTAVSTSWIVWPQLFIPVWFAIWMALNIHLRGLKLAIVLICGWGLIRLTCFPDLPDPDMAQWIEHQVITDANQHLRANWPLAEPYSWATMAALSAAMWRLPRQGKWLNHLRKASIVVVIVATLPSILNYSPIQRQFTQVRERGGYSHDHFLYQETWRLMKHGDDYYSAAVEAFRKDARGQGTNVRPPLVYWFWQIFPLPQESLLYGFLGATAAAFIAVYLLCATLSDDHKALLAPLLLCPFYVYGAVSASYLFVEYWLLPLVFLSLWAANRERLAMALMLSLVAMLGREFFGLIWLAQVARMGLSKTFTTRKKLAWIGLSIMIALVYYGNHRQNSAWVLQQNGMASPDLLQVYQSLGWPNLLCCLNVDKIFVPDHSTRLLIMLPLALLGWVACLKGRDSSVRSSSILLLGYWVVFWNVGHINTAVDWETRFPGDFWGLELMLSWLPWVPAGLRRLAGTNSPTPLPDYAGGRQEPQA